MNQKYEILLVGDVYDNHLKRLIRNLKNHNPNAIIDVLSFYRTKENYIEDIEMNIRNTYYINPLPQFLIGVPVLSTLNKLYNIKKCIRKFSDKKYDCINVHFPYWLWNICIPYFKKMSPTLLLSPWGSDVYRIGGKEKKRLVNLYQAADYVSCYGDRFAHDVKKIFNVPKEKFVQMKIGSETIDYICENISKISKEDAKSRLNVEDKYVITCGYNGSPAQNHVAMIEAISEKLKSLPKNLVLFFPVTYLNDSNYISSLKNLLNEKHLDGYFFEQYLSVEELFIIRQATDMFIHIQKTDAANSSLKEYILCNKVCLNGSWLKYQDLQTASPLPYYNVESIKTLGNDIVKAYQSNTAPLSSETKNYIASLGWKACIKDWDYFFTSCKNKNLNK